MLSNSTWGASLVVQGLRLCTPNAGGLGSIPSQGTKFHITQWRPSAAKKKKKKECLSNSNNKKIVLKRTRPFMYKNYTVQNDRRVSLVFYTWSLYSVTDIFSRTHRILSFPSVAQFPWECQDLNKILKIWRWGSRACLQHDWRVNLVLRSKVYPSKPNRQKRKMLTKPIPRICSPRPLSLTMELARKNPHNYCN